MNEKNTYEQFKDAFTDLCTKYTEYVSVKLSAGSQSQATEPTQSNALQLADEVRVANALASTLARMEALKAESLRIDSGY